MVNYTNIDFEVDFIILEVIDVNWMFSLIFWGLKMINRYGNNSAFYKQILVSTYR